MKKLIVLTAVTSILLIGGQQKSWADTGPRQGDKDYRTFKKIVRVLDGLINDDYRKGRTTVVVRKYSFPKKRVCYYKGPYEVCRINQKKHYSPGPGPRFQKNVRRNPYYRR